MDGQAFLSQHGLNLFAVLNCAAIPAKTAALFQQAAVPLEQYSRLVLIGNGGRRFWEALQKHGLNGEHPVDHFSETITRQFIRAYLPEGDIFWLFPSELLVPLQQLGALAGWGHDSPLGLGISAEYGLWFAYRAAFLTTAALPVVTQPWQPSPCDSCEGKPCITACPATAVRAVEAFDVPACAAFRLTAGSPCADRCLSRLACPIAPQHRYSLEQIQYHYGRSLPILQTWFG